MTRAYNTATTQQNTGGAVTPFTVGKNAIINGDFFINQRGFTSNTADNTYNFDRWFTQNFGGTYTITPQTFTPGAAPVAGYEGRKYMQAITASQSAAGHLAVFTQRIEDVTRFAGQTVTISFWAKADTGTPKIGVELYRNYGTGGSPSASETASASSITLTTSWARYSVTVAVPSLSGKTLGTTANTSFLELSLWQSAGANYNARSATTGIQNFTFSLWGVQVEAGSVATPFQTATGTIQGELAACQRYYEKSYAQATAPQTNTTVNRVNIANHFGSATGISSATVFLKVTKRSTPTITLYRSDGSATNPNYWEYTVGTTETYANPTVANTGDNNFSVGFNGTASGTANNATLIRGHFVAEAEL